MKNKLISNREMFRQLLARDILDVLQEHNAGNFMRLLDVKRWLNNSASEKHYYNLHTSKGWGYRDFNDRFFRAVQSINDKGYGVSIRKHTNGQLYVFSTKSMQIDWLNKFIAEHFRDWTACYNNNAGYRLNANEDEAEAMNVIDVA